MAKNARIFTAAEKAALLAEVERLYRAGGRTYVSIARELGIGDNSYHNWLAKGIRPLVPAASPTPEPARKTRAYTADERQRLIAEVERLHADGQSIAAACLSLGIRDKTFRVWRAKSCPPPTMRSVEITALVPVVLAGGPSQSDGSRPSEPVTFPAILTLASARPAPAKLTLQAPGGYRVEGLAIEDVAALLRALA